LVIWRKSQQAIQINGHSLLSKKRGSATAFNDILSIETYDINEKQNLAKLSTNSPFCLRAFVVKASRLHLRRALHVAWRD